MAAKSGTAGKGAGKDKLFTLKTQIRVKIRNESIALDALHARKNEADSVSPTTAPVMVAAVGLDPMLASLVGDLLRLAELMGSEATRECDRIFCVIGTRRFREAYAMESQHIG